MLLNDRVLVELGAVQVSVHILTKVQGSWIVTNEITH